MADDKTAAKQQRGRPFKKGESGNPKGKAPGSRHRATQLAQALLDGEAEGLARKVIAMAMAGDMVAMKVCMDRLVPPTKERAVDIALPAIQAPGDLVDAMASLLAQVASGHLTPGQAQGIAALLEGARRAIETVEIEARLSRLEGRKAK